MNFNTPILFLIFNRPEHSIRVFRKIQEVKPAQLFIAADGPRKDNNEDFLKCKTTRELVLQMIDWKCEVKTLFRDENLGCGQGVFGAISWFFENVDKGIILEDDCLPSYSFFNFCEVLLAHYQDDESVMHISGSNFQISRTTKDAYYFSTYSHNWGWATWSKSWANCDFYLANYDQRLLENNLRQYGMRQDEITFWTDLFFSMRKKLEKELKVTWDFQWACCIWLNNGLSILPSVNLVKNIGFDSQATHTKFMNQVFVNMKTDDLESINFISGKRISSAEDRYTFDNYYAPEQSKSFFTKVMNKLRSIIG